MLADHGFSTDRPVQDDRLSNEMPQKLETITKQLNNVFIGSLQLSLQSWPKGGGMHLTHVLGAVVPLRA